MSDELETLAIGPESAGPHRKTSTLLFRDAQGVERALRIDRPLVIGTSERADCRLIDPTVSRVHAEIVPRDDGVWIRDLGSRNGTFVNELRVDGARVPARGRIRVGGQQLVVTTDGAAREAIPLWPRASFGRLLGESIVMRALFAAAARVAASDSTVLVHGETGTGKELVAEAIHEESPRKEAPFVIVDCGALPESLLEAELFGHARGAFTGAVSAREGAFEAARGGTIFLDEIGELPLAVQPKLLRVLESKTVRRLGETAQRTVDVRVVCATHRDLLQMVGRGEFREDLYFRVAVLFLPVPPLRDHLEDVPLLVEHFLRGAPALPADVMQRIVAAPWPGNVRELRNFVDRVRALGVDHALDMLFGEGSARVEPTTTGDDADDLFELDYHSFRERWIARGEKEYLRRLLGRTEGVSAGARIAGVARTYLHRLLRKHGL